MSKVSPPLNPYLDIIPLAGVCDFEAACRAGIGVEANVDQLKRFYFLLRRSYLVLLSRIAATPIYEVKMGFSYHSYVLAENITRLRDRVAEMREPPLALDEQPEPAYALFFDEILSAPSLEETMIGLYRVAFPALTEVICTHLQRTNLLVDQPTVRILKYLKTDLAEVIAWGEDTLTKLIAHAGCQNEVPNWTMRLENYLSAAGGVSGEKTRPSSIPAPTNSTIPFVYDAVPKRDSRFKDPFNDTFQPEKLLHDPEIPPSTKVLILLFKRFREIDVPEMMASILYETQDQPWDYYADMTRQLWDEARHALMGEVGLVAKGLDWTRLTIRHIWSYYLNTRLAPLARHGVLYSIEKGLMPRTGKRYEWEVAVQANDPLTALFQDYDWSDEVLHARFGREWFVAAFKTPEEALDFCDAPSGPPIDYRALGYTENHDWWPEFYRYACEVTGILFCPRAIVNHTTPPTPNVSAGY